MIRIYIILFFQMAQLTMLSAEIPSDSRIVEILKSCHVLEDTGTGFDKEANLAPGEMNGFYAWFTKSDDPLAVLNNLVTDEKMRSTAVVVASEALDDIHFYQVSLSALKRFADGEASERELKKILLPDMDKRGLLDVHFRDERLQSVLKKCLARSISDPNYVNLVNNILSGEGAKSVLRSMGSGVSERYGPLAKKALNNTLDAPGSKKSTPSATEQSIKLTEILQEQTPERNKLRRIWPWLVGGLAAFFLLAWNFLKRRA